MRSIVLGFFCILTFVSSGLAQGSKTDSKQDKSKTSSKITSKFDKSKDFTTVRLKEMTITQLTQEKAVANNIPLHQMDLEISFTYPGQQVAKPIDEVILRFHCISSNYYFLRGQQVIVAINREIKGQDRAFSLGMTDYKSIAPKFNSIYEEFMTIKVPPEALLKISRANSAELYLGPVGYRLTKEQQENIASLASMLTSGGSSTASIN